MQVGIAAEEKNMEVKAVKSERRGKGGSKTAEVMCGDKAKRCEEEGEV